MIEWFRYVILGCLVTINSALSWYKKYLRTLMKWKTFFASLAIAGTIWEPVPGNCHCPLEGNNRSPPDSHPLPITTTFLSLRVTSLLHSALCIMWPLKSCTPYISSGFGWTNRPTAAMSTLHSCSIVSPVSTILSFKSQVLDASCQWALSHDAPNSIWEGTSYFSATFPTYSRISCWSGNNLEKFGFGANERL